MIRRKAAGFALAASFSVYLIPLVGPHAVWLLGEMLLRGGAERLPAWAAANLTVALAAQISVGCLFYWFFRAPGWRRAVPLLIAFPVTILAIQEIFQVAIPTKFLEEPDTAHENISWPTVCSVPDAGQTSLQTPAEVWLRYNQHPNQFAVLTMPACRVSRVTLPEPTLAPGGKVDFMIDVTSVIPGARGVVQRWEPAVGKASWWLVPGAELEIDPLLHALRAPERKGSTASTPPILSADGQWAAWLDERRVILRPVDSPGQDRVVDLGGLGLGSFVVRSLNMTAGEIRLWRTDRLITIGMDGAIRKEFARPSAARPQPTTYQERGDSWLAWDAYRDEGAYQIQWSLAGGSGSHRVPLGRTIHAAAFDASGKWIAISVGTSLNIGTARDAVYVLSAAGGNEVLRRYLPRYSRSPVAFLEGGYFIYSDRAGVRVLSLP